MTHRLILAFLNLFISLNLISQTKEDVTFYNTIVKDGYLYIPNKIFSDSSAVLLFQDLKIQKKSKTKTICVMWSSECEDGTTYYFTITPEQIYLCSGHNNPSPNFIFWLLEIDSLKYQQIKIGLKTIGKKDFSSRPKHYKDAEVMYIDKNFIDSFALSDSSTLEEQSLMWKYCKTQIKYQSTKIFQLLKTYLSNSQNIDMPEFEKFNWKYISGNKDEIIDRLPYKKGTVINDNDEQ